MKPVHRCWRKCTQSHKGSAQPNPQLDQGFRGWDPGTGISERSPGAAKLRTMSVTEAAGHFSGPAGRHPDQSECVCVCTGEAEGNCGHCWCTWPSVPSYGIHTDVNTHTVCSQEQRHGQSEGQAARSPLRRLYLGLHQPAGDGGLPIVAWLELQGHGARADVGNAQVSGGSGEFCTKETGQEGKLRRSFRIEQGSPGTEGAVSHIS